MVGAFGDFGRYGDTGDRPVPAYSIWLNPDYVPAGFKSRKAFLRHLERTGWDVPGFTPYWEKAKHQIKTATVTQNAELATLSTIARMRGAGADVLPEVGTASGATVWPPPGYNPQQQVQYVTDEEQAYGPTAGMSTTTKVAIGLGILALLGGGYYMTRKRRGLG